MRAAAASVLFALACAHAAQAETGDCALKDGVVRTVVRVLDGDTIVVDGSVEVRLIGALAPRPADAGATLEDIADGIWPLAAKAKGSLEELVQGRPVELGFAERRSDRYGRLLAHVFVRQAGAAVWVQGELLRRGLARAYGLDASAACLAELVAHERVAREAAIGLWAEPVYAVRGADEVDVLLGLRGTLQVVEGTVRGVGDVRGTMYLNFGEDYRQDFTVVVQGRARRAIETGGLKLKDLEGQRIRVRGWIERRGGPMIEIHHPAEVEVLAEVPDVSRPAEPPARRTRSRRGRTVTDPAEK